MIQIVLAAVMAAALVVSGFVAGMRVESNARDAKLLGEQRDAVHARQVAESHLEGVSVAYQSVADQLKRIETGKRSEVIREIQKVEYRCSFPDAGRVQFNATVDAVNAARGREPAPAVPAAPADDSR